MSYSSGRITATALARASGESPASTIASSRTRRTAATTICPCAPFACKLRRFAGEETMPTYITLANFTDQGVRTAEETVSRAEAAINKVKKHGVTVKDIYWTQ